MARKKRHTSRSNPFSTALAALPLLSLILLTQVSCEKTDLYGGPDLGATVENGGACDDPPGTQSLKVVINEVMLYNTATLEDEDGEFSMWIELYNPTEEAVNMGKTSFSDDWIQTRKWLFPCVPEAIIEPGGFLLLFLDGKGPSPEGEESETKVGPYFHTSFTPNVSGPRDPG